MRISQDSSAVGAPFVKASLYRHIRPVRGDMLVPQSRNALQCVPTASIKDKALPAPQAYKGSFQWSAVSAYGRWSASVRSMRLMRR